MHINLYYGIPNFRLELESLNLYLYSLIKLALDSWERTLDSITSATLLVIYCDNPSRVPHQRDYTPPLEPRANDGISTDVWSAKLVDTMTILYTIHGYS